MNPRYPEVATRAFHRCEYCHAPEIVFNFRFEVEHITPLILGGRDVYVNWALACRSCNLFKGSHLSGVDPETKLAAPLFDPRNDIWLDHFQVASETGIISGATPVGRATVARLAINSSGQLTARRLWIKLGVFP